MINFKNILKVLLIALFVCVWSGDARADSVNHRTGRAQACRAGETQGADCKCSKSSSSRSGCKESCKDGEIQDGSCHCVPAPKPGGANDASFCGSDLGIFKELVQTGQMIFNRLRDLIYVVAGFGIIAVAVGGFFGNLNWKWLGAIVISLVVIATAGELIVLLTGCEQFSGALITNTLTNPTPTMTTDEYNDAYTVETTSAGRIRWDDTRDMKDYYGSTFSNMVVPDDDADSMNPN